LSISKKLRWVTASAAITAATSLALVPVAQAAARAPAHTETPSLHTSGKAVKLGKASSVTVLAEAPDGNIAYAIGKKVYYVSGTAKPVFLMSASTTIVALAATNTALFVQTGLTVTEYTADIVVRHWKLSSPVKKITSAGLFVVGKTVWSWTDWATDQSGFEFATVSEFSTSASKVKLISKSDAFPGDMAADGAGLYYETTNASETKMDLVLTAPSGATKHRVKSSVDAPVGLSAGRVNLLAVHSNGHFYVDSFRASNLATLGAKRVPDNARNITGTSAGLLLLQCATASCSKASVGVLNPATGKVTGSVAVAHAFELLAGPAPAVLTDVAGNAYLVRLAK
jgi:hypothetical protein